MTELVVSFEIEGLHCWPDAPARYSDFRQKHRHLFKFILFFRTEESKDPSRRESELFAVRRSCKEAIRAEFSVLKALPDFGSRSCEGIADAVKEIIPSVSKVFVGEDWWLVALVS